MNPEEMRTRVEEIKARMREITVAVGTDAMDDEQREEWQRLDSEVIDLEARLRDHYVRVRRVEELYQEDDNRATGYDPGPPTKGGSGPKVPTDPTRLEEYRKATSNPEQLRRLFKDGAMKVADQSVYPHPSARSDTAKEHIEKLLERDNDHGEIAQRIIATGSAMYRRAFGKMWSGQPLSPEEERALSLTTTAGGYAVPFTLDPTIIPTSNGSVNPFRQISRMETITGNEWRGVASAGVTAAYAAEAAEATDNAPTLSQPTANVERAQVFIPFSIEIGSDWGSLESEMARLVQDAKDDLEADRFVHGLGHTATQPEGLLVGGTAILATAATATLAAGDVYGLENALPPRFRPRASIVGNRATYSRVRQLDTGGGANLWIRIGEGLPNSRTGALGEALLGYPTYEASAYVSTVTSASSMITIGDFSHFLIVDRAGMNVELLPHLLGSNRLPTGQRGLYFWWRNTSDVIAWEAFRTLKAL